MTVIACPECGKKMSSRVPICPNCGHQQGEVSEEQREVYRARKLRDRIYHLNMISYAVITAFVAGFGWYWGSTGGFQHSSSTGPYIVMALAAVAYIAVRALLFINRHKQRAMRKMDR